MQFQPKSEKDIQSAMLLPKGDYDFQVLEAEDTKSKQGNDMIKVNLGIFHGEAMRLRVFDYLLSAMEAKLRHFCDTTGLLAVYEAGTLCAQDCKGRSGRVKLIVEEDESGKYDTKNVVKDYICRPAKPIGHSVEPAPTLPAEDDIPF